MNDRINMRSLVLGITLGMGIGLVLAGVLQEHSRRLWMKDAEASDRAWEDVASRAYDQGFADCAKATRREDVERAGLR